MNFFNFKDEFCNIFLRSTLLDFSGFYLRIKPFYGLLTH